MLFISLVNWVCYSFPSISHKEQKLMDATKLIPALLLSSFAIGGCVSGSAPSTSTTGDATTTVNGETVPLTAFEDIPANQGTTMDVNASLIISEGEKWLGRLVLDSKMTSHQAFMYYRDNMPKMGWQSVAAVQGKNAVMTFIKPERVATLQFESGTISGGKIRITVSPHSLAPTN